MIYFLHAMLHETDLQQICMAVGFIKISTCTVQPWPVSCNYSQYVFPCLGHRTKKVNSERESKTEGVRKGNAVQSFIQICIIVILKNPISISIVYVVVLMWGYLASDIRPYSQTWPFHERGTGVFKELEFLILQDLLDLEDETKSDEEEEEEEVNCSKEQ